MKKDEPVNFALNSRKLNKNCIKIGPHLPNMEKLLNQLSSTIIKVENEPLQISKVDLDFAYGQLNLSDDTSGQCNFAITAGNMNGYYRFKKDFTVYPTCRQYSKRKKTKL